MKPALRDFISSSSIRCGRTPYSSPKSSPAPFFPPAPSSPARATTSSRERERPSQRASQFPLGQRARSTGLAKDPPPDPVSAVRRPPPPRGQGDLHHLVGRATSTTSRPMYPPSAGWVDDSRHGATGRGGKSGKSRGRLGLKKPSPNPTAPTPTTTAPSPTLTAPASRPPVSWSPAAPTPTPTTPTPTPTAPAPGQAPGSFPAPTCPPQGARWGSIPPNFAQDPNSWIYPQGGFINMIRQPNYSPQSQGENFHLIGQNMTFNPMSPPHPASSYVTPSSGSTEQAMEENTSANKSTEQAMEESTAANKTVKQRNLRYWTHDEEERLASSWLEISKDPIYGNDKHRDSFWKEITIEFNRKEPNLWNACSALVRRKVVSRLRVKAIMQDVPIIHECSFRLCTM